MVAQRGIPFETVVEGITAGLRDARSNNDMSAFLILCFLRDQSAAAAMATLEQALPFRDQIVAVGPASGARGHPPPKMAAVVAPAGACSVRAGAQARDERPRGVHVGA